MKKSPVRQLLFFASALLTLTLSSATRVVTWNLPADWIDAVSYPQVGDYRGIVGDELVPRSPMEAVGDPDLPFFRVNVDLPAGGTFAGVTSEAEWTPVDLGGAWPLPILQPVPTGSDPVIPALSAAYGRVFPKENAVARPLQILHGVKTVPVDVTPFRWDGATKTLYRATSLKLVATFDVVAQPKRLRLAAAFQPSVHSAAFYGDDLTADYLIISPPAFLDLWREYAEFRVTTAAGENHTFAVKSTAKIYEDYASVGGDDAFKIHRYLEDLHKIGNVKYILLGSAPTKYRYDPEYIVPSRYIVVGSSLGQVSDEYYGCMDRMPLDASGNELGVEVWDYDGDGAYMGHKNANGSYACDSPDKIDWTQELVVFRFPLMKKVVETRGSGASFERKVLTARDIMSNFIAKTRWIEGETFPGRFGGSFSGSTGFATSTHSSPSRSELYGPVVDERQFFDGGKNMFSPEHNAWSSDSEIVPRDRNWEFFSYLRGNDVDNIVLHNSSECKNPRADMYGRSGDVFHILAHGWARGCDPGSVTEAFFGTGYHTVYCCPIPCDSGMMDYCPSGSYGITNCICFGEAPILAPEGGALASFNNTRLGWSATFAMSYNNGKGGHSHRMDWLIFRAMSGVETGTPMDAGNALMFAKNNFNAGYYASAAWGLSGLEVTGQGDPLARFSRQYPRVWKRDAANGNWNRTDANWTIPGRNGSHAADYSTDISADLTGKSGFTFKVETNLASGGFFVNQDPDATLTIGGPAKYRVTRETVITNGHLRWEAAGGAGRFGVTFVGARGDLTLPGDSPRYFGEKFANVGDIRVTGGNVTIDTPRNAQYGTGKTVDFLGLSFVGDSPSTNNVFRTRKASFLPDSFIIPVVNSELILQVTDNPRLVATNAVIKVQANPLYEDCFFARPIHLNNSTLCGDFVKFALGPKSGSGFDLYVKGACRLTGTVPIKLNGQLRIHFEDAASSLEIENPLADGTAQGGLSPLGAGTIRLTGAQTFSGALSVGEGQTLVCGVADAVASSVTVGNGGSLRLETIPQIGLASLTVESGGSLYLPEPTYTGTYKIVDAATTTLVIDEGARVYDKDEKPISGEQTQGHYVLSDNQLVWQASGETWNLNIDNTTAWKTAAGAASAYADNSPLRFRDLGGDVTVRVGADVAPGFVDFGNTTGRYLFVPTEGLSPRITFNSLVSTTPMTFDVALVVPGGILLTAGAAQFKDVTTPKVEVADAGFVRATGRVDIASQQVRRLKFVFSGTRTAGERTAISELRLFNAKGRFMLPEGTVIRDIAGDVITVCAGTQGEQGQVVTGSVGDERLSALVDGNLGGGNKWWASKSASPTWFEITFPVAVDPITGYSLRTADQEKRDPKDWTVYAMPAEDDRYSLVASEADVYHNARRDWITNPGASPRDRFSVGTMSGLALVRAGGHLVLDGTWCADLELEADAVLAVTNRCCLTAANAFNGLYLPENGTVKIDLSLADRSAEAFPVLTGYGITAAEFARFACVNDTAMLLLKDGDIYAATDNVAVPPYAATVSGTQNWSDLGFTDKNGKAFTWKNANVKADGTVTLTVSSAATVTMDAVGTVASLTVTGGGNLTVNPVLDITPLAPAVLDDSAHTGALVWNLPIGSTDVKAGADTTIGGGAVGTGRLTVDANKKVTLGDGVTFANRTIDPSGWVRFAGTREGLVLADWPAAAYSFENAMLAGSFTLDAHTIRSRAGDSVRLVGTNDNYNARSLINFDIAGGLVEIAPNGESTWFGRTGTTGGKPATTFKMTGGTFRCLASGTGTGGGLLVGYEGGDAPGNEITLDISGGTFEVPDSFLNFGTPTVVNVVGGGCVRAKGYTASMTPGVITLGTNVTDNAARFEIGALGFGANAVSLVTMRDNASIVGYEPGASFSGSVLMYAANRNTTDSRMYFCATNGASLALKNVIFSRYASEDGRAYNGSEAIVFGNVSKDLTGEVRIQESGSLPDRWTVGGGSVNLGAVRASAGSLLTARPTTGRVTVELTYDEYCSGMAIEILNCGSWSDALDSAALRGFLTIRAEDASGELREIANGTVKSLGGIVNFLPEGASGYVFPISAKVTQNAAWSTLDWKDRNGVVYTNDWHGVTSVELVNESGTFAVTMDRNVSVARLATRVSSGKSLTLSAGGLSALTITGVLDDSTSAGTTVLDIALGEGVKIAAGKALQITGADDATVPHGTLTIGAGSVATVVDGYWNGEVVMADSTSKLQYKSTETLAKVPNAQGPATVGYVEYFAPMTPGDGAALFGSADAKSADGLFYFREGANLQTARFVTGKGNGTVQTFFQDKNTTVVISGDQGAAASAPSLVIGNDLGSSTTYYVLGGTFVCDNAPLVLGANGTANFMFYRSGTCYRLKGVTTNGKDNNSSFTLSGTLELGSDGIDIVSSVHSKNVKFYPFNWAGTIVAKSDTTIRVPGGVGINYEGRFKPGAGATIRVESPLVHAYMMTCYNIYAEGDGKVEIAEVQSLGCPFRAVSGTLRLARYGLLNSSLVKFDGGDVEVLMTRDEATTTGRNYTLFRTDADIATVTARTTVLASETESVVDGTFTKDANGYVVFTPAAVTNIKATSDGFTGDWSALTWTNAKGEEVGAGVWNSTLGTATLTSHGTSALTFGGTCAATQIGIVNDGDLSVSGSGTMTVTTLDDSQSAGMTRIGPCFVAASIAAGKNTVVEHLGAGKLTIGSGRHATVSGMASGYGISGDGAVSFNMGSRDAALTWGSGGTSPVAGTNELVCGTWTHTTTSTYPRDRDVVIRGTNAVLRFATSTDISGYDGYAKALTIADGATWLVDMRDTFTRPLYLVNGAKVLFKADNNNSGRSFDFFSKNSKSASLTVSGAAPCILGGQSADVTSLSGSGIVAVRLDNFTVDVKPEATLKVYSQWGYGNEGAGNAWIKNGAGTMELYRAGGQTGKVTVNAGCLRLIDAGVATTGAIENNATLEIVTSANYTKSFANAVTGSGRVVKSGAGLIDYGTVRPQYAIDVREGRLRFRLMAAEKAGGEWIQLYKVEDSSHATGVSRPLWEQFELLDVDAVTPATISETRLSNGWVEVKVETYRMPITLTATSALTRNWVDADWKDANKMLIPSSDWAALLQKTNLVLNVVSHQDVVLNVNTNVTAKILTVEGNGAVAFNSVNGCTLTAETVIPSGTFLVNGAQPAISPLREGAVPAGWRVRIAAGTTFTNAMLAVTGAVSVTHLQTGRPFQGDVVFAADSTLDITMTEFATIVPLVTDGKLTIDGDATIRINGEVRPSGTWNVSADGKSLELPVAYPVTTTLTGGGEWTSFVWQDAKGVALPASFWDTDVTDCDIVIQSDVAVALTLSKALSIGKVTLAGKGAVTLPANLTLTKLMGSGTVVVNGTWPGYAGLQDENGWKGTVKLTGNLTAKGQTFSDYGNASSSIEIAGAIGGYLKQAGACDVKIVLSGTLTFNNGYSNGGGYAFNGPLSGAGTIATSGTQSDVIKFLGDVSGFTGTVTVAGDHCVAFGDQADTDTTKGKISIVGRNITLRPSQAWSAVSGIVVASGAELWYDVDAAEFARRAVGNVPYRAVYVTSPVSGEGSWGPKKTPVPSGYTLTEDVSSGYSAVVSAPEGARFGVVSLNLHNGAELSVEGNHGLYPDDLANWGSLQATANRRVTVSNATFTVGGSASGYGIGTYTDEIYRQYMDDNATTRTILIGSIPFEKYRIIVYYSTDTANYQFQPLVVNDGTSDTSYAGLLQNNTDVAATIRGRNATWGNSGPDKNMNAIAEGVNLLVTDMMTSPSVTLKFTRVGNPRATPSAIQIVKVGEVYSPTVIVDPASSGGVIKAADTKDVKIVCVWTNGEEEVKLDLTSAFTLTKVEGGVTAVLNPAASVTIGEEPSAEVISVTPELTDAEDETEPFVVSESVAVGVRTIPGLTYKLMRGNAPGALDYEAASERATSTRLQLEDANKPPDKAFYRVRVER